MSVLIVGSGCGNRQDETILAAQAQSVDDVDIHLVDLTGDTFGADWVAQHSVQPEKNTAPLPKLPEMTGSSQ